VLNQADVKVRVLIIDDASPDMTPDVASELMSRDRRVEYTRHATNLGHIATYNEGIDWATGDYALLLSADDLLAPGALARAVRLMDGNPEVGMVYGREITLRADGRTAGHGTITEDRNGGYEIRIIPQRDFLRLFCAAGGNLITAATAVVRTRLQKELGGYLEELPHTGDMEMWMRFGTRAPVGFIGAVQAFYRWHAENMQRQYLGTALGDLRQRLDAFEILFRDHGHCIQDLDRLRAMALRGVAAGALWSADQNLDRDRLDVSDLCMQFAWKIWPRIRFRPSYARLRLKRMIKRWLR